MRTVDAIPLLRFPWNAPAAFTYRVPDGMPIPAAGSWVRIFFRGKERTGIIAGAASPSLPRVPLLSLVAAAHCAPLPYAHMEFIKQAARTTFNHPARFLMRSPLQSARTPSPARMRTRRARVAPALLWWTDHASRKSELLKRAKKFQRTQHLILAPTVAAANELHAWLRAHRIPAMLFQSRAPVSQRSEIAHMLLQGKPITIVGTRASLFLPFLRLAAVTVDFEEHWAYDQDAPPPRYHGRSLSYALAYAHQASHCLLSPAPSIESVVRTGSPLPQRTPGYAIELLDATSFNRWHTPIALHLVARIQKILRSGASAAVITPETGFAPYLQCRGCRFLFRCPSCALALGSESAASKELICNRCGYRELAPPWCPACQSVELSHGGFGPARLMEFLKKNGIPARSLLHVRPGEAACCIVASLRETITQETHFTLLVLADADPLLSRASYAATMRAFQELKRLQCMAQSRNAAFVIQTATPSHPVYPALAGDARALYAEEIRLRTLHHYPPFATLIQVTLPARTDTAFTHAEQARERIRRALKDTHFEMLPSERTHRRRMRIISFTIRHNKKNITRASLNFINNLLKKSLPASAMIVVDPDFI